MVHARVVRPPSYGARLISIDSARVQKVPGLLRIVRNGSYIAVVAEREYQAIQAMRALAQGAKWEERATLPQPADLYNYFQKPPRGDFRPDSAVAG